VERRGENRYKEEGKGIWREGRGRKGGEKRGKGKGKERRRESVV